MSYIPDADYLDQLVDFDTPRLRNAAVALAQRCEALEELLACYRVSRQPSEALFRRLKRTRQKVTRITPGGEA